MTFELLLPPLAKTLRLSPHFELVLEIGETLPNQLHIENACHTLLIFAERLKLRLEYIQIEFDGLTSGRATR